MMRYILFFVLVSSISFGQKLISLDQIPDHMGKNVKICDMIYGSYITKGNSPVTLLNVGEDFPDNPITFVVYAKDRKNFSYDPAEFLVDKTVCAIGKLVEFKGKPQIVLNSEKNVEIQTY